MPYIKVSPSALSSMSETLRNSSSKVGRIESDFSSVAGKLDWDVRSASDIQRRMDRINGELEDQARTLSDMRSFIDGAKRKYEAAQKEDGKLQKLYLSKVDKAVVALDKSMMTEAEKLDEREKTATCLNYLITGLSIAATIAAGVFCGPVAFVVASAIIGGVSSGAYNLTEQYAEDGCADGVEWDSLGKDVAVGTVSGIISGCFGLGGKAVSNTALVTKVSQNTFGKYASSAVVNMAFEAGEGVLKRGAEAAIESEGDVSKVKEAVLNGDEIIKDLLTGAVLGIGDASLDTYKQHHDAKVLDQLKTDAKQDYADRAMDVAYRRKHIPSVEETENITGLTNLKEAKNHAVDFRESEYILKNKAGDVAEFKIKASESVDEDNIALIEKLQEGEFDVDFRTNEFSVHRMADYDVATGEYTVQVVRTEAKNAVDGIRGKSISATEQYRAVNNEGYGKRIYKAKPEVFTNPKMPEPTIGDDILYEGINDNATTIVDQIDELIPKSDGEKDQE